MSRKKQEKVIQCTERRQKPIELARRGFTDRQVGSCEPGAFGRHKVGCMGATQMDSKVLSDSRPVS
jgi:hypothetical protein